MLEEWYRHIKMIYKKAYMGCSYQIWDTWISAYVIVADYNLLRKVRFMSLYTPLNEWMNKREKMFFLIVKCHLVKCLRTGGIRGPPFSNQNSYTWQEKNHQWLLKLLNESIIGNRTLTSFKASPHNALNNYRLWICNLTLEKPGRYHLNYVTKMNITSTGRDQNLVSPDKI